MTTAATVTNSRILKETSMIKRNRNRAYDYRGDADEF